MDSESYPQSYVQGVRRVVRRYVVNAESFAGDVNRSDFGSDEFQAKHRL